MKSKHVLTSMMVAAPAGPKRWHCQVQVLMESREWQLPPGRATLAPCAIQFINMLKTDVAPRCYDWIGMWSMGIVLHWIGLGAPNVPPAGRLTSAPRQLWKFMTKCNRHYIPSEDEKWRKPRRPSYPGFSNVSSNSLFHFSPLWNMRLNRGGKVVLDPGASCPVRKPIPRVRCAGSNFTILVWNAQESQ